MRVLVVNAGSSSLKLRVLSDGYEVEVEGERDIERWDGGDDATEPHVAVVGSF